MKRQPKGVRIGGQFAVDARNDDIDDLDLTDHESATPRLGRFDDVLQAEESAKAFAAQGIPAIVEHTHTYHSENVYDGAPNPDTSSDVFEVETFDDHDHLVEQLDSRGYEATPESTPDSPPTFEQEAYENPYDDTVTEKQVTVFAPATSPAAGYDPHPMADFEMTDFPPGTVVWGYERGNRWPTPGVVADVSSSRADGRPDQLFIHRFDQATGQQREAMTSWPATQDRQVAMATDAETELYLPDHAVVRDIDEAHAKTLEAIGTYVEDPDGPWHQEQQLNDGEDRWKTDPLLVGRTASGDRIYAEMSVRRSTKPHRTVDLTEADEAIACSVSFAVVEKGRREPSSYGSGVADDPEVAAVVPPALLRAAEHSDGDLKFGTRSQQQMFDRGYNKDPLQQPVDRGYRPGSDWLYEPTHPKVYEDAFAEMAELGKKPDSRPSWR